MKGLFRITLGLALVVALAACSSNDSIKKDRDAAREEAAMYMQQVEDIKVALEAAGASGDTVEALIQSLADMVSTGTEIDIDALEAALRSAGGEGTDITALVNSIVAKLKMEQEEKDAADRKAMMEAMAKTGKAMYGALGPNQGGTTPLTNIAAPTLSAAGLAVDAAAGAGSLPDATDPALVTLKAGDSAGALGAWMGTNYAHTNSGTKVMNAAVVYNNKGPAKSVTFAKAGYTVAAATSGDDIKGYLLMVNAGTFEAALDIGDVMASDFTHSGTQTHQKADRADAVYVRGTYDGAPGEYRCAADCSSTNDGKGSPSALGGTWHFKPDANAMVSQPDTDYLYYGWWVSKDKDGMPTAASAFAGIMGDVDGATTTTAGGATLTGSATYVGHAAGKFALNNPLDGTGDGGHFTADATLTAKFGGAADAGMTGMIDNFMANDKSVPWSVSLHRAGWGSDGAISAPVDDATTDNVNEAMGTTWSNDGNSADRSGTWSGQMYDEMPGDPPDGDGNNIPTTVTGTFYSEFGTIGRMVGAFGADKQ